MRRDKSAADTPRGADEPFGAPGQYNAAGVDLSLIRANMRLTPSERARRAERERRAALRVAQLGRASRTKSA